jgi:hypothetical protein
MIIEFDLTEKSVSVEEPNDLLNFYFAVSDARRRRVQQLVRRLRFGYELSRDGVQIDTYFFPPEGTELQSTDQPFIDSHSIQELLPGSYTARVWCNINNFTAERNINFNLANGRRR